MTDKKHNNSDETLDSRRRSVKKILGAGGLLAGAHLASGQWVKPVVNSVVLPAHAQTSQLGADSLEDPCSISVVCSERDVLEITVSGFVTPPTADVTVNLDIEVALGSNSSFEPVEDFASTTTDGNGEYSETRTRSQSGISEIRITATLPDFPEAGEAVCTLKFSSENPDHEGYFYFCDNAYPISGE